MNRHKFDGPVAWLDFRLWRISEAMRDDEHGDRTVEVVAFYALAVGLLAHVWHRMPPWARWYEVAVLVIAAAFWLYGEVMTRNDDNA